MKSAREFRRRLLGALFLGIWAVAAVNQAHAHEGALGNEVMWEVCQERQINDSCSFENAAHELHRGTCQSMADNLVCVRNEPIVMTAGAEIADHEHAPVADSQTDSAPESSQISIAAVSAILILGLLLIAIAIKAGRSRKRPK